MLARSPAPWRQKPADLTVRAQTEAAFKFFLSCRVPGVAYDVSSVVGAEGQLILTWTPRGRV